MADTKELVTTDEDIPKKYVWRANRKQIDFMERWLSPHSETYSNVMKSAIAAGYSKSYAEKILTFNQVWISEYMKRVGMTKEHIKMGIQQLALEAPDSRSPDDTRLKAFEILGKIEGMIDKPGGASFTFVQPILGGKSVNKPTKNSRKDVIEGEIVDPDELIPED